VIMSVAGGEPITRDGARAAARRELSKGIYHRDDESWPLRLFNAVQRWIDHLIHSVSRHAPGGGVGALALLLAAVALVAFVWWRVGFVRRTISVEGPVLAGHARSSADLLREAVAAAAAGRWDDAVIARMRALAMAEEERGLVDPRPGRTADELAVEVAVALPVTAGAMRSAASAFDTVAYGKRPAERSTYDVIVDAADLIEREHRSRRLLGAGAR
jgi:Domain of unknown function (DUF4129)